MMNTLSRDLPGSAVAVSGSQRRGPTGAWKRDQPSVSWFWHRLGGGLLPVSHAGACETLHALHRHGTAHRPCAIGTMNKISL
jgi:hypothetical protein